MSSTASQASSVKVSGPSFQSMLSRASSDAVNAANSKGTGSQNGSGSAGRDPSQEETQLRSSAIKAVDNVRSRSTSPSASKMPGASQGGSDECGLAMNGQTTSGSKATSGSQNQARPVRSQTQSKAERDAAKNNVDATPNAASCDGSQQVPVAQPTPSTQDATGDAQATTSTGTHEDQMAGEAKAIADARLTDLQGACLRTAVLAAANPASLSADCGSAQLLSTMGDDGTQAEAPASGAEQAAGGNSTLQGATAGVTIPASLVATSTLAQGAVLSKKSDANGFAAKAGQSRIAGAGSSSNLASADLTDAAGRSKSSTHQDSVPGLHGAQSNGQLLQQQQNDALQALAAAVRTSDSGPAQPAAFVTHMAAGQSVQSAPASSSTPDAAILGHATTDPASELLDETAATGTQGINTARVIQGMSETEMRVGMHSTEFGDISIRTSVSQQQMHAQISVDHGELGSAITAHIPALQTKLGDDFGLHTNIEVNHAEGFLAGGQEHFSQQNPQTVFHSFSGTSITPATETESLTVPLLPVAVCDYRLDIRA